MTAAQIRTAAKMIDGEPPFQIVTLSELGSEGALFWIGPRGGGGMSRGADRWLIARDGEARRWPR